MNETPVDIEVVIDRSGSMGVIANDAIGGYNTWLEGQKAVPGEANLTLTLFDHEFIVQPTVPLLAAQPLNSTTYVPRGSTALNDAIGQALNRMEARNSAKAILVVLTDGHENASHEFTTTQIKDRVEKAQARGWQVVYLSADIKAFDHAKAFGVLAGNTVQFTADAAGLRAAYTASATLTRDYRSNPTPDGQK